MNTDYKCVTTVDGIKDYIGDSRIVAFDFETAPDDPYREEDKAALDPAKAHIVGCSFSVKEGTGVYVPVAHRVGTNIDRDAFSAFLTAFLMDKTVIKIAHNIAFESSMAYARGIVIQAPVYDTICASQMSLKSIYEFRKLNESGLKRLAEELFGEPQASRTESTLMNWTRRTRKPSAMAPRTPILPFGSITSSTTGSTATFRNTGTSWRRSKARPPCTSAS